jgi:hypothetical protein
MDCTENIILIALYEPLLSNSRCLVVFFRGRCLSTSLQAAIYKIKRMFMTPTTRILFHMLALRRGADVCTGKSEKYMNIINTH